MSPIKTILSAVPDTDDVLRRLADLIRMPETCRRRACTRALRCRGGYGPPCYFAGRESFAEAVRERMHEVRDHWDRQRRSLEALLRP